MSTLIDHHLSSGPEKDNMQVDTENNVSEGYWKDLPQDLFNLMVTHAGDKYKKLDILARLILVSKPMQNAVKNADIYFLNRSEFPIYNLFRRYTKAKEQLFEQSHASKLLNLYSGRGIIIDRIYLTLWAQKSVGSISNRLIYNDLKFHSDTHCVTFCKMAVTH